MVAALNLLFIATSAAADAAAQSNPFVQSAPPPPLSAAAGTPQANMALPPPIPVMTPDPVPVQFTDNRSVFDQLAVVGINGDRATLRHPVTGAAAGAQGSAGAGAGVASGAGAAAAQQFRVMVVKDGNPVWLNGRKYLAKVDGLSVRLVSATPIKFTAPDKKKRQGAVDTFEDVVWSGDLEPPRSVQPAPNPQDIR
jgi:hypothetical protein